MNFRNFIIFLFVLVVVIQPTAISAQENYFFTHLKSDAGLPHQQVESMAFDHNGLLWVGTRNGLAKYDGYSFVTYYHSQNDETSIPHNFIRQIYVDSENNVWIGSDREVCRYQRETDDFRRYDVKDEPITRITETLDGSIICTGMKVFKKKKGEDVFHQMPRQIESFVVGLDVSPDNRVFVATNQSISYFTSEMVSETVLDSSVYADFLSGFDAIVPLFFDKSGLLWIGRDGNGIMSLNLSTGEKKIYDASRLTDGTVRVITEDSKGNIWLGTERGITIIDPASGVINKVAQRFGNSRTLSDNAIYCIVPDNQDNIWIGTYFGGINLMLRDAIQFHWTAPGYEVGTFSGKAIRGIAEPEKGKLWLATEDGGINIYDTEHKQVEKFNQIPDLGSNVHELFYDKETGDMWIGTFRNGLFRYNLQTHTYKHYTAFNSGLKSNAVFAITRQNNDQRRLWIATTLGLMCYDPESDSIIQSNHPALDTDFIYCLHPDLTGNLWVGTVNRGLFRVDGETGEVKGWSKSAISDDGGLNDNYVTSIYEDNNGRVFVGTNNGGVQIINSKNFNFRNFTDTQNTFGTVCAIKQDMADNIWITTSNGLYKVDPKDL